MLTASRTAAVAALVLLVLSPLPVVGASPDCYLPDNAEVVLTINVRQLFGSSLVIQGMDKLREALKASGDVQAELDAVGFDPFTDLDSVTLAGPGSQGSNQFLVIAHGRFDFEKIVARVQTLINEHSELVTSIKEEGCEFLGVTPPERNRTAYLGWPDNQTIILSSSKELLIHAFQVQAGKVKPSLNQAMAEMVDRFDEANVISIAGLGNAFKDMPQGEQVRAVSGGLAIDSGLRASLSVCAKDADTAQRLATTITDQITQFKNMVTLMSQGKAELAPLASLFDAVSVKTEGDTVTIKGEINEETLKQLQSAAASAGQGQSVRRSHRGR